MQPPLTRLIEAPDLVGTRTNGYGWTYSAARGAMVWTPRSRQGGYYKARGDYMQENYPLMLATTNFLPTSQTAVFQLLSADIGDVITGIALCINVAAVGAGPTGIYVGLYDSAGVQLAVSANLTANGQWLVATPAKFAFTTPYAVLSNAGVYAMFLQNGTFATTQPQLARIGGGGWNSVFQTGTSLITQNTQAAQATPPSPATYTGGASNQQIWVGWY